MKKTVLLSIGTLAWLVQSASAQSTLFTTTDDFALFSGGSPVVSTDFYSDSSAVNGLGNQANAGAAGGVGSLQLTMSGGWGGVSSAPGVAGNQSLLSVLDPGAVAGTSLVPFSGTLTFDIYKANLTDWNQFGFIFNYSGNWNAFFWNAANDFTGADGRTWTHCEVPYTINAVSGLTYFGIDLAKNTGGNIVDQIIYVDNFQVATVPEPGSFALLGLGSLGAIIFRRRAGR